VPYDFIEDTATTQGVKVDEAEYKKAMEGQRDKRAQRFGGGKKGGEEFRRRRGAGSRASPINSKATRRHA